MNGDFHPQYNYNGEDEYEVNDLFDNSVETSDSAPVSSEKPEDPKNSWRTTRSPVSTDQTDESPDSNEDTADETVVSPLNGLMGNMKIDRVEDGC